MDERDWHPSTHAGACPFYSRQMDYYIVLGVSRTATVVEVKRAFRKLAVAHAEGRRYIVVWRAGFTRTSIRATTWWPSASRRSPKRTRR